MWFNNKIKILDFKLNNWETKSDGIYRFSDNIIGDQYNGTHIAVVACYHYQNQPPPDQSTLTDFKYNKSKTYLWHIRFQYKLKYLHEGFGKIYNTDNATITGTEKEIKNTIDAFLIKMSKLTAFQ
jgi:hypothetical protein